MSRRTLSIDTALMWDILCHTAPTTQYSPPGDGLFDPSFLRPTAQKRPEEVTVETEIFHHSARAVDTSDGGQALPPYSSNLHGRPSSENADHEPWTRNVPLSAETDPTQGTLPRDQMAWSSAFPGDVSFMDVTHDPFFQFQDQDNPYRGFLEIGNL